MNLIEFKDVSFSYSKDKIISRLSLSYNKSSILGILGPSGCGKSTVLRLIAGLEKPSKGAIIYESEFRETPIQGLRFAFQDFDAFPWLTVEENLCLAGASQETTDTSLSLRELLQKIGLYEHKKKYPSELSGGMRKRLALARTVATKPHIILLDEPFSSLDIDTRYEMYELLQSLWLDSQCLVVLVTHDIHEAVYLCGEIIVSTPAPFEIKERFDIPFDYPRTLKIIESSEFIQLVGKVSHELTSNRKGE